MEREWYSCSLVVVVMWVWFVQTDFRLAAYMSGQDDITPTMRAILIDWLIEVQENFELFHETLYLAVQLTDHYLAGSQVQREYLQLVGATAMLIAAKFEVREKIIVLPDYKVWVEGQR